LSEWRSIVVVWSEVVHPITADGRSLSGRRAVGFEQINAWQEDIGDHYSAGVAMAGWATGRTSRFS